MFHIPCSKFYNSKGFTLIELLVVIAIIGVLSSVVLVSLSAAREKARDAARKSDITQIAKALEMYYLDHGHYPWWAGSPSCCGDTSMGACTTCPCSGDDWSDEFDGRTARLYNALDGGEYIELPLDPLNNETYYYRYCQRGNCYCLRAILETGGIHKICGGTNDASCTYGWGCCGCP